MQVLIPTTMHALLQQLWVGVMHLFAEIITGLKENVSMIRCLIDPGDGKQWIEPTSTAAETLRDLVFDCKWLNSLSYYVHNRHTGTLEVRNFKCTYL